MGLDEAADLREIRRHVARRCPQYSEDWRREMVSEMALEIVGRYRRNPELSAAPGPVREMALREARRRFLRSFGEHRERVPLDSVPLAQPSFLAERVALEERIEFERGLDAFDAWVKAGRPRKASTEAATRRALNSSPVAALGGIGGP